MKKTYNTPEVAVTTISASDILNGSDVFIDGSVLFGEE